MAHTKCIHDVKILGTAEKLPREKWDGMDPDGCLVRWIGSGLDEAVQVRAEVAAAGADFEAGLGFPKTGRVGLSIYRQGLGIRGFSPFSDRLISIEWSETEGG